MMERKLIFQRLVQRDMSEILRYYQDEAGEVVADRFYQTFLQVVDRALENPEHFHPVSDFLRRAPIPGFSYHFLYRKIPPLFLMWRRPPVAECEVRGSTRASACGFRRHRRKLASPTLSFA